MEKTLYQNTVQLNGTKVHEAVDNKLYSGSANYLQSLEVYSEKYNLIGKIDMYDTKNKTLIERKKHILKIYDGYIFQVYGQYFAMTEMGYEIKRITLRSIDDNKQYPIELPTENNDYLNKFNKTIEAINAFDFSEFKQTNTEKCGHCIYEPYCDRSVKNVIHA